MTSFTGAEQRFLARQPRGHPATVGPGGNPLVAFVVDEVA